MGLARSLSAPEPSAPSSVSPQSTELRRRLGMATMRTKEQECVQGRRSRTRLVSSRQDGKPAPLFVFLFALAALTSSSPLPALAPRPLVLVEGPGPG